MQDILSYPIRDPISTCFSFFISFVYFLLFIVFVCSCCPNHFAINKEKTKNIRGLGMLIMLFYVLYMLTTLRSLWMMACASSRYTSQRFKWFMHKLCKRASFFSWYQWSKNLSVIYKDLVFWVMKISLTKEERSCNF